ncbi:armadillo-type protein [Mycena latifolia]|nr:armadillo-type protein [Mycena latifolia]
MDAGMLDSVGELLNSPDPLVRRWTCQTLGKLAHYEFTTTAILRINPCLQLVPLLRDENLAVAESAAYALFWIAKSPEGAQAVVDAESVAALVDSLNAEVRRWTGRILGRLAYHDTTTMAISTMKPCRWLVSLLRDESFEVVLNAVCALYWIARSPDGAQIAVNANVLDSVGELLQSANAEVRSWTCSMLARLVRHGSVATAVLGAIPCRQLVFLSRGRNLATMGYATEVLCRVARSPEGAQAVVDAGLLVHVGGMLVSPSTVVQRWTCATLGQLAWQESTRDAVLRVTPCPRLVSLLRDETLRQSAAYALAGLSRFPEGAQAVMEAKIMDVAELLRSTNARVRHDASFPLGLLDPQNPRMSPDIHTTPGRMLVSLLRDEEIGVVEKAAHTLFYAILKASEDSPARVDGNVIDCVTELLESPNSLVRNWTGALQQQLLSPEPTTVLDAKRLIALCREQMFESQSSWYRT